MTASYQTEPGPVLPQVPDCSLTCARPGASHGRGRRHWRIRGCRDPLGLRTSIVCEHIRNPHPAGPGWRAWRAALGLPLAPLISSALRDWETRVTGKADVPCGAHAAEVGGAPPCLVELPVPAGSAEPWLRTQLQPRSIRRPFRHETQNMPSPDPAIRGITHWSTHSPSTWVLIDGSRHALRWPRRRSGSGNAARGWSGCAGRGSQPSSRHDQCDSALRGIPHLRRGTTGLSGIKISGLPVSPPRRTAPMPPAWTRRAPPRCGSS